MGAPNSAAAVATDALLVSLADPHLLVLGLLVFGWVVDKLLAAVAHPEAVGPGNAPDRPDRRGEPNAVGDDGRHPSGAE